MQSGNENATFSTLQLVILVLSCCQLSRQVKDMKTALLVCPTPTSSQTNQGNPVYFLDYVVNGPVQTLGLLPAILLVGTVPKVTIQQRDHFIVLVY